ncbi:MAG: TetR/AcrR family transcriptional regulator [Deinococcota bacterium]
MTKNQHVGRIPKQQRSRETVARILDAAVHIVEEQGLAGLVMHKVAREAGVGQATLYTYFPTPEQLIARLGERVRAEVEEALDTLPELQGETTYTTFVDNYLTIFVRVYKCNRLIHHLLDTNTEMATAQEHMLTEVFVKHFTTTLERAFASLPIEVGRLIAIGFLRITDAFLWYDPPNDVSDTMWHAMLARTLVNFLAQEIGHQAALSSDPSHLGERS